MTPVWPPSAFLSEQGGSGREIVERLTALTDELITAIYRSVSCDLDSFHVDHCALFALGGYGRAEMNPRSDLDLMFFYDQVAESTVKTLSDRMLYLLWDMGFDVGYSVRTARDCIDESKDATVRTSLLDARFLTGNPDLLTTFATQVGKFVLNQEDPGLYQGQDAGTGRA